jgi:hypothetical protein
MDNNNKNNNYDNNCGRYANNANYIDHGQDGLYYSPYISGSSHYLNYPSDHGIYYRHNIPIYPHHNNHILV